VRLVIAAFVFTSSQIYVAGYIVTDFGSRDVIRTIMNNSKMKYASGKETHRSDFYLSATLCYLRSHGMSIKIQGMAQFEFFRLVMKTRL
jgi:hypothetical protein